MPQLDKFSFVTQIFWLLLLFFFMYIILLNNILPSIYKILKIRKELLNSLSSDVQVLVDEEFLVRNAYKDLFSVSVVKSFDFLSFFQKRSLFFKHLCTVYFFRVDAFSTFRESYKNSLYILKIKKKLLSISF